MDLEEPSFNPYPTGSILTTGTVRARITDTIVRANPPSAPQQVVTPLIRRAPTLNASYCKAEREHFAQTRLSKHVQAMLNCPFGKERTSCSFMSEPRLRHVLSPLWNSGFLADSSKSWSMLASAIPEAQTFLDLLQEYGDVDFNPLRDNGGYPVGALEETELNEDRIRMLTAALLYFEGNSASLVRWLGGPHVAAHRDTEAILQRWRPVLQEQTYKDLARVFRHGIPNTCANAHASETNFQTYLAYGNHSTVDSVPEKAQQALLKDFKRSFAMVFDPRLVHFSLNCHLTPIGLVDINHRTKKPRNIFDSSFHPEPASMAINDWTTKSTEPKLHFADAFMETLIWFWNLRISYPDQELYAGEDDQAGAFRHCKYQPNVVAMHSSMQCGRLVQNTGGTFGDNTTPGNYEAPANARTQVAQHIWHQDDIVDLAAPFLPPLELAPPPTLAEIAAFSPAEPDSQHTGVIDANGNRLAPLYRMHVDDCCYGDIADHMPRTVSASALSIYEIFGYPMPDAVNALSQEKFDARYNHLRKMIGFQLNTRALHVDLTPEKRQDAIEELALWGLKHSFTLKEAAQLCGLLDSLSRYNKWGRALFFALVNAVREAIRKRYYIALRILSTTRRIDLLQHQLPATFEHRLDSLVSREIAKIVWHTKAKMQMTVRIKQCLEPLYTFLNNPANSWAAPIAFIVKRDPHAESMGDASNNGGGAHCDRLYYWFDIVWSPEVRRRVRLPSTDPDSIHINCLEFAVVLLQFAAFAVRLRTLPEEELRRIFGGRVPQMPVLLSWTDNTVSKSWANRVTSSSEKGQWLIGIYAEMLRTLGIGINTDHIPGIENVLADFISRPSHFELSVADRAQQICRVHPSIRTYAYFQPSPELLHLISSALFTRPTQALPSLPKSLGQFVPADCITSCSPMI